MRLSRCFAASLAFSYWAMKARFRRGYTTLRIPESIVRKVHGQRRNAACLRMQSIRVPFPLLEAAGKEPK